ncbi:hypothetical protein BELL_0082g00030 [Botrytis elliptica]|uniref:Uncharacterized protein n=1 Tax=Botrytis elliptica TaxID=278938 RepID=A0A4Z1JWW5_9HELO|nr:hypothetical protein BELL_0082g00030 [Botrytis elliptica]
MGANVNEGPKVEDGEHGSSKGRRKAPLIDLLSFPLTSRAQSRSTASLDTSLLILSNIRRKGMLHIFKGRRPHLRGKKISTWQGYHAIEKKGRFEGRINLIIGYYWDAMGYGRDWGRDDVAILRALMEKGGRV